jgi:putative acetyltransferase
MADGGLTIRSLEPEDYADWAVLRNCPYVQRNTLGLPCSSSSDARRRLEEGKDSFRSLVAVVDGHVVAQVGLELMRNRRSHVGLIGIMVHDDYTRRGIASALLAAMLDIADNWLNLHRLELQVYTDNERAINLYKKFGFEIEGTLRDYAYGDGHYLDAYEMARLRPRP